jgi:hypothetical protein
MIIDHCLASIDRVIDTPINRHRAVIIAAVDAILFRALALHFPIGGCRWGWGSKHDPRPFSPGGPSLAIADFDLLNPLC